jgi:hypothetical protein
MSDENAAAPPPPRMEGSALPPHSRAHPAVRRNPRSLMLSRYAALANLASPNTQQRAVSAGLKPPPLAMMSPQAAPTAAPLASASPVAPQPHVPELVAAAETDASAEWSECGVAVERARAATRRRGLKFHPRLGLKGACILRAVRDCASALPRRADSVGSGPACALPAAVAAAAAAAAATVRDAPAARAEAATMTAAPLPLPRDCASQVTPQLRASAAAWRRVRNAARVDATVLEQRFASGRTSVQLFPSVSQRRSSSSSSSRSSSSSPSRSSSASSAASRSSSTTTSPPSASPARGGA